MTKWKLKGEGRVVGIYQNHRYSLFHYYYDYVAYFTDYFISLFHDILFFLLLTLY